MLKVACAWPSVHPSAVRRFHHLGQSLTLLALGATVLGAFLAVVKGRDYGLGYFVGNLSTPYLVAAFFAGRAVRSRAGAALAGVVLTWTTLAAFYLSADAVFGYPSGSMTRFYAEWFTASALSGIVLGLLGRGSRKRSWLVVVLPLALVLEPFAVIAVQAAGRFGGLNVNALQLTAWVGEIVIGCIALSVLRLRSRRTPTDGID